MGGEVPGQMGVEFMGWRDWVERVGGWWQFWLGGSGGKPNTKST